MRKLKKIPKFKSEAEEVEFWATHDSTEYVDYSKAKRIIFPELKAIYQDDFDSASGISYRTSQSSCQQERRALSVTLENVSVREGGRRIARRNQIRGCALNYFLI